MWELLSGCSPIGHYAQIKNALIRAQGAAAVETAILRGAQVIAQ